MMIKYSDDFKNRDLKIIKICASCNVKYHPRKNSYQLQVNTVPLSV
jgi:hypothetical protein